MGGVGRIGGSHQEEFNCKLLRSLHYDEGSNLHGPWLLAVLRALGQNKGRSRQALTSLSTTEATRTFPKTLLSGAVCPHTSQLGRGPRTTAMHRWQRHGDKEVVSHKARATRRRMAPDKLHEAMVLHAGMHVSFGRERPKACTDVPSQHYLI